jgi:hypothetical protein
MHRDLFLEMVDLFLKMVLVSRCFKYGDTRVVSLTASAELLCI